MDLYCPICGEPVEFDELHDVVAVRHDRSEWYTDGKYDQDKYDKLFRAVRQEFRTTGCATFGSRCNSESLSPRNNLIGEVMDLLGDDLDGAASMLDDARHLGLF
jgi:hypothetical protein